MGSMTQNLQYFGPRINHLWAILAKCTSFGPVPRCSGQALQGCTFFSVDFHCTLEETIHINECAVIPCMMGKSRCSELVIGIMPPNQGRVRNLVD